MLGAISHIAVIFCNNDSRMLRCCSTEHYLPNKNISLKYDDDD